MHQRSESCAICVDLSRETTSPKYPSANADDERERVEKIRGCLIGGAIGDAVGRLMRQGLPLPTHPEPGSLHIGGATQLALFSAECMLRMLVRYHAKGIGPAFVIVKHAYDRWLFTQGYAGDANLLRTRWGWGIDRWPDGWLVHRHELHHRRSEMATTVAALRNDATSEFGDDRRLHPRPNGSRGAGGVVRAAPGGLLVQPEFAFEMGARLAGYTHGHPDAFLAAGILSSLVCRLLHGDQLEEAAASARTELAGWPGTAHAYTALEAIIGHGPPSVPVDLSPALEALAHGMAAGLTEQDAMDAVQSAASTGGTSAAVIAGQLLGVIRGSSAWSDVWRRGLEVSALVDPLADAVGIAHRAWILGRRIEGADWRTNDIFEEHPVSALLWSEFPGW